MCKTPIITDYGFTTNVEKNGEKPWTKTQLKNKNGLLNNRLVQDSTHRGAYRGATVSLWTMLANFAGAALCP